MNTYALFAELFARLASKRGRAGVIVPTGIATDATTAPFFRHLVESGRVRSLIGFSNQERLFPAVLSLMTFALLTIGQGSGPPEFAFFLTDPRQLAEPERRFTLSAEDIARINPNTKTAPVFRSRADAELTAKIYARVPVLVNEAVGSRQSAAGTEIDPTADCQLPTADPGNPWGVSFMAMFHMSNDSGLFRTAAQLAEAGFVREGSDWVKGAGSRQSAVEKSNPTAAARLPTADAERYVPLYEAKMIHQFDHRWATYAAAGSGQSAVGTKNDPTADARLPTAESRDATLAEKQDPNFEPTPRYWVPEREVAARLSAKGWRRGWLMGWRDIARTTDERTVIAAAFPRVGCGDTLLLKFPTVEDPRLFACNVANLCSLALDYAARQKIGGTHLKYNVFKQLPVLPPSFYTPADLAFIVPRVLELTYTSWSMKPFADDIWQSAVDH
ncbi:MAG TPA: hypothetical protein VNK48_16005 [Xanthobacteraceae bacterium]|nr:hypothetical protein [Xanthobacteraceae bacterium]